MKMSKQKIASKDLISIGLFGVLMFIVEKIVSIVLSPVTLYILPVVSGICTFFMAIIYLLMSFKVGKKWTITLMGAIMGIFFMLMGVPIMFPFCVLSGLIAEATLLKGDGAQYRNFSRQALAYSVYGTLYGLGTYVIAFLFGKTYFEAVHYSLEMIGKIFYFLNSPLWMVLGVVCSFVLTYLGMLFGRIILKKHFVKSGYIKEL